LTKDNFDIAVNVEYHGFDDDIKNHIDDYFLFVLYQMEWDNTV
jgi:hypothetical protein